MFDSSNTNMNDAFATNPYIAVMGGLTAAGSVISDIDRTIQFSKEWEAGLPGNLAYNNGIPSYGLGESARLLGGYAEERDEVGRGLVGRSGLGGAQTGAAIGSMIPGGAVVGGLIGGGIGLLAGGIAKGKARREADESYNRELTSFNQQQGQFNRALESYSSQQDAYGGYQARVQKRRENLFNIPNSFI